MRVAALRAATRILVLCPKLNFFLLYINPKNVIRAARNKGLNLDFNSGQPHKK